MSLIISIINSIANMPVAKIKFTGKCFPVDG